MLKGKLIYRSNVNGDLTVEEQIERVKWDSLTEGRYVDRKFEDALRYDIVRTITNILGNSVITYRGEVDTFCESLQRNLVKIFFALHDSGKCYLVMGDENRIEEVRKTKTNIELIDPSYDITGITQKKAAELQMKMYGVVTNTMFSMIDERGVMGVFSPQKDVVVKKSMITQLYEDLKSLFGVKTGQRKFAVTEVPMTYSGVSLPVAELELLENERNATAKVARLYGIQEDMILSGSTFDNKENAIVQTYTDYKGLIYNWITQIESEMLASFRQMDGYNVTFPGVPQMNKTTQEVQR
jgi:hypothetical protein